MKCRIHTNISLIPGIINIPQDSLSNNEKQTSWQYLCPICYEAAIKAAEDEWGTKFPSA